MNSYIARQPIFTPSREVYGYELLFRSGPENIFEAMDGDVASARVVGDALHVHEIAALGNGGRCFINVTGKIILEDLYTALPPEQVVLELLETIEPSNEIIAACKRCREAGYTLALDDYIVEDKFAPILPLIDILKVDFAGTTAEQQEMLAKLARKQRFELLAEKVQTYDEFRTAKRQGYQYFQGFFFCKPEMLRKKDVAPLKLAYMQLLQQIAEPTLNHEKLADVISRDLALSYKLLRYLNSGAFRFRSEITSIRRAIALLGDEPLRRWASLMVLGILGDAKPQELLTVCMTRAKFCEQVVTAAGHPEDAAHAFMAGMFSVLPAMLDQPLDPLLKAINLPSNIERTLRGELTTLRPALELVLALEEADWQAASLQRNLLAVSEPVVSTIYLDALRWAADQTKIMSEKPSSKAA